jgi:DNA-binding IclR family transcriptional regulator
MMYGIAARQTKGTHMLRENVNNLPPKKDTEFATKPVRSVQKAFTILEVIAQHKNIGVSDLSRHLGWHKSTVFGILSTLEQIGYVVKDPDTSRYRLSLKLFGLASEAIQDLDLYQIVHPYLKQLTDKNGETTHFVLPDTYEVIYVDKVESSGSIRICTQIGKRMPYYCTGVGKAILAFQPEDEIKKILSYSRLVSYTQNTITDYNALLKECEQIRRDGYALDKEEVEDGLFCVAVPILSESGKAVAAMSMAGPTVRMTPERLPGLIEDLLHSSGEISRCLGYTKILK